MKSFVEDYDRVLAFRSRLRGSTDLKGIDSAKSMHFSWNELQNRQISCDSLSLLSGGLFLRCVLIFKHDYGL